MAANDKSLNALLENRFYIGKEIPTSGAELAQRLTESLQLLGTGKPLPADGVRATITTPPNIDLLQLDLSGFVASTDKSALERAKEQVTSDSSDVADRVPAAIDKVMLKAHPLTVQDVPAEFDLQAEKVPFNWVVDKQGGVWFGLANDRPDEMHGEFTARIEKSDLRRAVSQAVAVGAEQKGFALQDLNFDIKQVGNDFLVAGNAKLRKGILSARADAKAQVEYDPAKMVATVKAVDVHSSNPAVGMILRMMDAQIAQFRGKTFDLNALLGRSGIQFTSLEVDAGAADLRLHGKF